MAGLATAIATVAATIIAVVDPEVVVIATRSDLLYDQVHRTVGTRPTCPSKLRQGELGNDTALTRALAEGGRVARDLVLDR